MYTQAAHNSLNAFKVRNHYDGSMVLIGTRAGCSVINYNTLIECQRTRPNTLCETFVLIRDVLNRFDCYLWNESSYN